MMSRTLSLLIWALVAACAVFWGLRLFTRPSAVPGGAVVATAPTAATGELDRMLGAPPVQAVAEAAVVQADSRFKLLGLVAPRAGQVSGHGSGLALISVDGKPARAVAVGREVEAGGLRLLAVSQREADLGAAGGAPTVKLVLPMLAEANRGRLGDAPGMAPPAQPLLQPGAGAFGQPQRPPQGAAVGQPGQTGRMPGLALGAMPQNPMVQPMPGSMPQGGMPQGGMPQGDVQHDGANPQQRQ